MNNFKMDVENKVWNWEFNSFDCGQKPVADSCGLGNESSRFINHEEFVGHLNNSQLQTKDSVALTWFSGS